MTTPATNAATAQAAKPRIDTSRASAIDCLIVDDNQVLATVALGHLLELVPDPVRLEDKRLRPSLLADPSLAEHIEKREAIQRVFTGAKRANLPQYAKFITERTVDRMHRGTPPICLGTTSKLQVVIDDNGHARVGLPFGRKLIAVDGETQRASWEEVHRRVYELVHSGLAEEDIFETIRIPVEIHHGLDVDALGDLFYERNVLGAKVNANEAIARDTKDPATQIVRAVERRTITRPDGKIVPISTLVMSQSRQVGKKAPEWITLSALRTFVVTTLLGRSGFQYGAKPVPPMPDEVDMDLLREEVVQVTHAILQRFAVQFAKKDDYLIGAPAILAGIGVVANRALTALPAASGRGHFTVDELLHLLDEVRWEREGFWDGVGTRKTPKGATTVAGPKEVGYAVADAIEYTNQETGAQVRGKRPGQIIPPYQPAISPSL